jgi:single-strand DNA-binding protein
MLLRRRWTVTKTQAKTHTKDTAAADAFANDVRLVGRLTAVPELVELQSGDALVTFRISVARDPSARPAKGQRVDSVPCTAWTPRLRRSILTWRPGDLVEISGAVRCRFFQAGGATRSRVEVEASAARIMRRSSAA